jgi:hypothetical protein
MLFFLSNASKKILFSNFFCNFQFGEINFIQFSFDHFSKKLLERTFKKSESILLFLKTEVKSDFFIISSSHDAIGYLFELKKQILFLFKFEEKKSKLDV